MWAIASVLIMLSQNPPAEEWAIGGPDFGLLLQKDTDGRIRESCRLEGRDMAYTGTPAALMLNDGAWIMLDKGAVAVSKDQIGKKTLVVSGSFGQFEWKVTYTCPSEGLVTKQLWLHAIEPVTVRKIAAGVFTSSLEPEIVSTNLQDIAVFLHNQGKGVFLSLDFPYSRIVKTDSGVLVTYPPERTLKAGDTLESHSLTLGATQQTGVVRYGRDTGDVEAMDAYIQNRFPNRFEKPMFVSASINNRYTMPVGDVIFPTYKDHPTFGFNLDLLEREIDLLPRIGMEYYQVFPGVFDWVPEDPKPENIRNIVKYGADRGVRIGDYSGTSSVFCPHYNEHRNTLDKPEWRIRDAKGNAGGFCFGCPEFVDHYAGTVVAAARKYGFKIHCLDFLGIAPCSATHGHPAGEESVYHQVAGIIRIMSELAKVNPEMMVWSNSGNWAEFLPKIAWWNPNMYITDPYIGVPWQGLNMTRLLDDARREQMAAMHYRSFIPYRYFTNCQYFFSQNSIVPDIRNYEYGALSTIAITPNLCLAEVRPWMDRLSVRDAEDVKAFYTKWTGFLKQNFNLWKKTWHIGDNPTPGGVEVYGHSDGTRGFVFIVNPNYWSSEVEVPLDERLGFTTKGSYELKELYPVEHYVLTSEGPTPEQGALLKFRVEAQQVRVLEVSPAKPSGPKVYGIPAMLKKTDTGYALQSSGAQGTVHRFCIVVPDGEAPILAITPRDDIPMQPKRIFAETKVDFLGCALNRSYFEIKYRRSPAPTELREWTIQSGDFASGAAHEWFKGLSSGLPVTLPLGVQRIPVDGSKKSLAERAVVLPPIANFTGAYIDNALCEIQPTLLELTTQGALKPWTPVPQEPVAKPEPPRLEGAAFWGQTRFTMPFIYTIGAEPAFDEHTVMVFPMLDAAKVKQFKAWLNGVPLEVRQYAYPRNRALASWWADLVGSSVKSGDNTLVVFLEF